MGGSELEAIPEKEGGVTIRIRGRVVEGLGRGSHFTRLAWVKAQFISKLSIDPYPGTLNLEAIDAEAVQNFERLKKKPGIPITPEEPSYCLGICYPAVIQNRIKAAIVVPMVASYPKNKVELIASENLREALSLKVGDLVEVEILFPSSPLPVE